MFYLILGQQTYTVKYLPSIKNTCINQKIPKKIKISY
jgi:hypothetical protein